MRKNPRRILSPQRLPFRHPGIGNTNLANPSSRCNTTAQRRSGLGRLRFFDDDGAEGTAPELSEVNRDACDSDHGTESQRIDAEHRFTSAANESEQQQEKWKNA